MTELFAPARRGSSAAGTGRGPSRGPGRRTLWRRAQARRVLAALLAGLAVWVVVGALLPGGREGGKVVVARADLPAGHRVSAADVELRRADPGLVPEGAIDDPAAAVGSVLGSPVGPGETVTRARLRPAASIRALPADHRAVHLPVADAAAVALARPGDRVDVLALDTGAVVGSGLLVLAVDAPGPAQAGLAAGGGSGGSGLVVAAPAQTAAKLVPAAARASGEGVHITLVPDAN